MCVFTSTDWVYPIKWANWTEVIVMPNNKLSREEKLLILQLYLPEIEFASIPV